MDFSVIGISLELPQGMREQVCNAYAKPPRAYHNLEHIREVLGHFAEVAQAVGWHSPHEVYLALLFHDAVYEAGRKDNEALSAELATQAIAHWLPQQGIDAARVAALIRMTARHGHWQPDELAKDSDAALFLDCDMAILAANAVEFDAYDRAIAQEYRGKLPAWMFRHYRRRFLRGLRDAPRIFVSEWFHARCDAAARANLSRVLGVSRDALKASAGR